MEAHGNDRPLSVVNCSERGEETFSDLLVMISLTRKNMSSKKMFKTLNISVSVLFKYKILW